MERSIFLCPQIIRFPCELLARTNDMRFYCLFQNHVYFTGTVCMMTSSNGDISALLAICAGNSPVPGEFPAQRPVTRSFDVFSDLRLNKRLSKQSRGCWFETLSRPLWRHRNVYGECCRFNRLLSNHNKTTKCQQNKSFVGHILYSKI